MKRNHNKENEMNANTTSHQLRAACQTITFGNEQRDFLPRVFESVASAGYTGVEIGFRHIRPTQPSALQAQLDAHGLSLAASHIGGNLQEVDQAAGERAILDETLDYLEALGTTLLMYSGLKFEDDERFARDLAMLCASEKKCRERGVRLLYHNHDWEFADDGRVIEALIKDTDLGFCPDIGWVIKGGWDPLALLERLGDRVGALHLKDFATKTSGQVDTVMLGEGVAPLRSTVDWAAKNQPDLWLIAEQDRADVPPEQAITQNAKFIQSASARQSPSS